LKKQGLKNWVQWKKTFFWLRWWWKFKSKAT